MKKLREIGPWLIWGCWTVSVFGGLYQIGVLQLGLIIKAPWFLWFPCLFASISGLALAVFMLCVGIPVGVIRLYEDWIKIKDDRENKPK